MKYIVEINHCEVTRVDNFIGANTLMNHMIDQIEEELKTEINDFALRVYEYSPITEAEVYFHADSWTIEKAMWYDLEVLHWTPEEVLRKYCPELFKNAK